MGVVQHKGDKWLPYHKAAAPYVVTLAFGAAVIAIGAAAVAAESAYLTVKEAIKGRNSPSPEESGDDS